MPTPNSRRGKDAGFTLVELMVAVGIIGLLASVAVPAYGRYAKRVKTAEATQNLRLIFDASVAYFEREHKSRMGGTHRSQFPKSQWKTPRRRACKGRTPVRHAPDAELWDTPTWRALNFAIDDPSNYQYAFKSSGRDVQAAFTAYARGDLDCDKVFSTFERVGEIDEAGNVVGGAAVYAQHVTE